MSDNFAVRSYRTVQKALDHRKPNMQLVDFLKDNRQTLLCACTFEIIHQMKTNDSPVDPASIKKTMFAHLLSGWDNYDEILGNFDLVSQFFEYTDTEKTIRELVINQHIESVTSKKRGNVVLTSSFSERPSNGVLLKLDIAPLLHVLNGLKLSKHQNLFARLLRNDILVCQQEYIATSTRADRLMKIFDQPIFSPFELTRDEKEILGPSLTA